MERDATITDLFERLDRERQVADRQYNDALTALDQAHQTRADLPSSPLFQDASQIERLNTGWKIVSGAATTGDRSLRGRLRGFIWRVLMPTFEAQQQFNAAVVDHLSRNLAAHERATRAAAGLVDAARRELEALHRFEWLLLQFLQTVTAYVDTKDRSNGGPEFREQLALLQQRLTMVEREMTRLDQGGGQPTPTSGPAASATASPAGFGRLASVKYLGFEDRFRGTTASISERLASYVPLFATASNVIDVGCGRGELLDLLRKHGVSARGIDTNQAMVDECRSRGLVVEQADALTFLEAQKDGELGGLVAIQVVEHFEPEYLVRVLELAYQKLGRGAPLVLETINPACWMAFFETYLRDLTHARPLHPDTLRYLVQASGFTSVNVEYRQPVTDSDRLERLSVPAVADGTPTAVAAAINDHADKLNRRLFSSMDYAVVARR